MHTYPYVLKRIFFLFWRIGFPCTKRSPKRNFMKNALDPEWKIDFPYWCERMKKETFENETPRYLISHGTSMFVCHLLYLNLSVAYLN